VTCFPTTLVFLLWLTCPARLSVPTQLLRDYEDVDEVNKQLDKMGFNIGGRLVDEFLAKSNVQHCADFRETAEAIGKVLISCSPAWRRGGYLLLTHANRPRPRRLA
jgi:hypothetical protein